MKYSLWKRILTYFLVFSLMLSNINVSCIKAADQGNTEETTTTDSDAITKDTQNNVSEEPETNNENLDQVEPTRDTEDTFVSSEPTEPPLVFEGITDESQTINDETEMYGSGTEENPFLITSAYHLSLVKDNLSAYYRLGCDIDLEGAEWTPIGDYDNPFTGQFCGNGYTISNYTITSTNSDTGFFGDIRNGVVKDLTLADFTMKTMSYTGALVGRTRGNDTVISNCHTLNGTMDVDGTAGGLIGCATNTMTISECTSNCTITSEWSRVGGIVGYGSANMTKCAFTGKLTGTTYDMGGIIGYATSGVYDQCYSTGEIEGQEYLGGIIGEATSSSTEIKNCFTLGKITATKANGIVGGIISSDEKNNINVTNCYCAAQLLGDACYPFGSGTLVVANCYYDNQVLKLPVYLESKAYLTSAMVTEGTYKNWDFETIWTIDEDSSYPYIKDMEKPEQVVIENFDITGHGTEDNPYLITGKESLEAVGYGLHGWFSLENDIDLDGQEFTPIAINNQRFSGHFLGNGHTISNFHIARDESDIGLFGEVWDGEIKDLTLSNFIITGKGYTGGLAGVVYGDAMISNCHTYNGIIRGEYCTGGLLGMGNQGTTVIGCSSNCDISSISQNAGGLIGHFVGTADSKVENCVFKGKITSTNKNVGGIAGRDEVGTYYSCYSTGKVEGSDYVGGIVGSSSNTGTVINNCFSLGKVTATGSSGHASGILGGSSKIQYVTNVSSIVNNCFCAAELNGANRYAIGYDQVVPRNCYNDVEASGLTSSVYNVANRFTGQMLKKANYSGWDFETVWDIEEGKSYPYFQGVERPEESYITKPVLVGEGTEEEPFRITEISQLEKVKCFTNSWISLENDLDLEGRTWEPFGVGSTNTFAGHFLGNGHTISNFKLESTSTCVGFFGRINNAEIKDLTLRNFTADGTLYTAGLVGYSDGESTKIDNCHTINGTITGSKSVGSIVGHAYQLCSIKDCSSNCNVTATSSLAGGLVGSGKANMEKCFFTGKAKANSSYAGGLIGECEAGTIEKCYSTGDISADSTAAGLIGNTKNSSIAINNCFALGLVTTAKGYTGGLFSNDNYGTVTMTNCYCGAKLTGTNLYGIGPNLYRTTNSYYDKEICGVENTSSDGVDRTTLAMTQKNTYQNWDFDTVWDMENEGSYPYLRGMKKPGGIAAGELVTIGDGTEENPYLIYGIKQLEAISGKPDCWYSLKKDIDMGGAKWTAIGTSETPFTGHFLGNGHTISNFRVEESVHDTAEGLFGYVSNGEIRDVTIKDFSMSGNGCIGGIASQVCGSDAKIINCHAVDGTIRANYSLAAGIVGSCADNALISGCTSNCEIVASNTSAGGIQGMGTANLVNCAFTGKVTSECNSAGGILGTCGKGIIEKCYSTGDVYGYYNAGGIFGDTTNAEIEVKDCFTLGNIDSMIKGAGGIFFGPGNGNIKLTNCYSAANIQSFPAYGMGSGDVVIENCYFDVSHGEIDDKTTDFCRLTGGMAAKDNFKGWDFETVWDIDENNSYPFLRGMEKPDEVVIGANEISGQGTEENPYVIKTPEQFEKIGLVQGGHFKLESDMDLGGRSWKPLGTDSNPLQINLDGNGHCIYNFTINSSNPYTGFFGQITKSNLENLTFRDFSISGGSYVGGIVGYIYGDDTKITNCHTFDATIEGTDYVGGLVGYGESKEPFTKCSSNVSITSTNGKTGGLVGQGAYRMEECSFTGTITSNGDKVGGLIGDCKGGKFYQCYSSSEITGKSNVGGLIGERSTGTIDIMDCFTLGNLEATDGTVGAFIGSESYVGSSILYSYSAAELKGSKRLVAGEDADDITNIYYNAQRNDLLNATEYDIDRPTAALTREANFKEWDFENIWAIKEGESYPYLRALEIPDKVNVGMSSFQGVGTEENPYLITNKEELQLMNYHLAGWFKLENDIDLNGEEFTPIATKDIAFRGNLDGQEHTISNYTITSSGDYVGFFTTTKFVKISNLNLDHFTVTGNDYVGGLIAKAEGGKTYLYNCHLTNGVINGHSYVGGIAGSFVGTMKKCTFSGIINATGDFCGGAAGYAPLESLIDEVETKGSIRSDGDYIGGITGGGGATVIDSKTDVEKEKEPAHSGEISGGEVGPGSKNNVVEIKEGRGTETEPYVIHCPEQIGYINEKPDRHYILSNDIIADGKKFPSIGTKEKPFSGTLDGGGHKIIGPRIPGSIFGKTDGGVIKHLTIQDAVVTPGGGGDDTHHTSVLVAENDETTLTFIDCHINNTTITAKNFVGSLIGGSNGKVIIIDCSSDATINADGSYVGGLAGNANTEITRSYFEGNIHATGDYIGGLVGFAPGGHYEESYCSGILNGNNYVGGLVGAHGNAALTILNCYAAGIFTGKEHLGGILGRSISNSSLTNVYAAAQMEGTNHIGGIEGDNKNVTVTNCYYDMIVSKLSDSTTWGRVTADMLKKSNFINWNFDDIWHIKEGKTYPYLQKEEMPQDIRVNIAKGRIIDAVSGEVVPNATINVRVGKDNKTGTIVKTLGSDNEGKFIIVDLKYNTYTLEIVTDGFITEYQNVECKTQEQEVGDIGLLKEMPDNYYQVKLSWGSSPTDLDSSFQGKEGVSFTKDITTGFGPEITRIQYDKLSLGTYRYCVNWIDGDGTWDTSDARVEIYRGKELIHTVTPPQNIAKKSEVWNVFDLDAPTGEIRLLFDDENTFIDWDDETDSDGDGITDVYEINRFNTDPNKADTDGDGLPDLYEIVTLQTDPTKKDTDDNGISDDKEDFDLDGLNNQEEYDRETNPFNPDTDEDGLTDGGEVHTYHTDPLKEDTDEDGVTDGDEVELNLNPTDKTDGNTIIHQTLSEDEIDLNEDNDDVKVSVELDASNSIKTYFKKELSPYAGMLLDNKAIIGQPIYLYYEAGKVDGGKITFRLEDSLLTEKPHYYPDLNLGIKRYGIFTYDENVNTIVPVPCTYKADRIEVDPAYMGNLMVVDYETLMYDLGIDPDLDETGKTVRQVDLVLVVDTTGSMGSSINTVRQNLTTLIEKLREDGISLYVSVVDYCDILSEGLDSTRVNNNSGIDFYNANSDILNIINNLNTRGGSSECAVDGLGKAYGLNYRSTSSKYLFLITDEMFVTSNTCDMIDMADVAQKLHSKGVNASVVTQEYLYGPYSDLTSITGGESININSAFCNDMYRIIYSKTPQQSVLLANSLTSGYFKQPLTYQGTCDTDGDTLTDSEEIDWRNVKEIHEDGSYELYTWGELYQKSSVYNETFGSSSTNPLFTALGKIKVLPGLSSPFLIDTDRDYYPDNEDENPLTIDAMEIDDEGIDDTHLHDEEYECDEDIQEGDEDDASTRDDCDEEEDVSEEEEGQGINVASLAYVAAGPPTKKKFSDGVIHRPDKDEVEIYQEFSRGKNYSATFDLTPEHKSFYTITVTSKHAYSVKVTYNKGKVFKKTKTVKKRKDGTYLLSKGKKYTIKVLCKKLGDYKIKVQQANWVYAPGGGIAEANEPITYNVDNYEKTSYYKVNYKKTYIPESVFKELTQSCNWSLYDVDPNVILNIRATIHRLYLPNDEERKLFDSKVSNVANLSGTVSSIGGFILLFVPGGKVATVAGYILTYLGVGSVLLGSYCSGSQARDARLEKQFNSTFKKATKKDRYSLCLTQYQYFNVDNTYHNGDRMKWSSWTSGYIYKFAKDTGYVLTIHPGIQKLNYNDLPKKKK